MSKENYIKNKTHIREHSDEQNQSNPIQFNASRDRKGRYFQKHLNTTNIFHQATEKNFRREVTSNGKQLPNLGRACCLR